MTPAMSRSQSEHALPMAGGGAAMIDASPGTWPPLQSHRRQDVTLISRVESPGIVLKQMFAVRSICKMYLNADQPAMISVTHPTPQWAQLKINLLDRDTNNTNILIYCHTNIIIYITANKSHSYTFNPPICQSVFHIQALFKSYINRVT